MPDEQESSFNIPMWAGFGIPAVAAYLMSRGKYKPVLGKAVADRIKQHGLVRGVVTMDKPKIKNKLVQRLYNYLQFAADKTIDIEKLRKGQKKIDIGEKLFWGTEKENLEYIKAKHRIGIPGTPGVYNKAEEYRRLLKAAPGVTEPFVEMTELMKQIPKTTDPTMRVIMLQKILDKHPMFKGRGYIIKGKAESATIGSQLTNKTNLVNLLMERKSDQLKLPKNFYKQIPDVRTSILREKGLMGDYRIDQILNRPEELIAQRLIKTRRKPGAIARLAGDAPDAMREYRIHVVNGKVIPGTSVEKSMPWNIAAMGMGISPSGATAAEQAAQRLVNRIARKDPKMVSGTLALDLADTGKGFKVIETNPDAYSGYLHPYWGNKHFDPAAAIRSHVAVSKLQGQDTHLLSGLKGLAAGAAGAAATPVINSVIDS